MAGVYLFAVILCATNLVAQTQAEDNAGELTFDVASVRPHDPNNQTGGLDTTPGQFRATNNTLKNLIMDAYNVLDFQISGGPGRESKLSWIDTETYDVVARTGGNLNNAERDRMLQSLLADRFQLKIRRESKQGTVYELETARKGPKITASPADAQYGMNMRRNLFTGTQIPMDVFAAILSSYGREPVIDKTELKGGFDITFRYSQPKPDDLSAPSIFTEVEDQLGLRLVPKKGPIEMLIVESAERPGAN